MTRDRLFFLLLNLGHFLDHLFTLIFATVAALALTREWGLSYGDLVAYATPGFFAFGVFALPAGWLADKWSRDGMMVVYFVGIGLASIATALATTAVLIGAGLFAIGIFAAIYHPVGIAIVSAEWRDMGLRLAVNGVWGNLGVASAALLTGFMIDNGGWRAAFVLPGLLSVLAGLAYLALRWDAIGRPGAARVERSSPPAGEAPPERAMADAALLFRVSTIVLLAAAVSSISFQATTFALPKVFDERLRELAGAIAGPGDVATTIGALAFLVFALASFSQIAVGRLLDRLGPRPLYIASALLQVVSFLAMPGLSGMAALIAAVGFMLGTFGQLPITDFMIGRMASSTHRARVYAARYVVSFTVLAATLPLISLVHERWGFETLFRILAVTALVTLAAVSALPARLPGTAAARA